MDTIKAFEKRQKEKISVKIELRHIYPPNEVVIYKNTKTSSGIMGITTAPKNIIGATMLSYIHILCETHEDFNPVIRFANEQDENCMTLVVFGFNKKHLTFIKKYSKKLGEIYYCKAKVTTIDFKDNYSNVMENKKI